jgi:hypothetical protein
MDMIEKFGCGRTSLRLKLSRTSLEIPRFEHAEILWVMSMRIDSTYIDMSDLLAKDLFSGRHLTFSQLHWARDDNGNIPTSADFSPP